MKNIIALLGVVSLLAMSACSTKSTDQASNINGIEQQNADKTAVALMPVSTDGTVISLDDARLVAPGNGVSQLTVLDFNAVWCGPCRQLAPVIEEMAKKYEGKVTFISVDVDKYRDLFEAYDLGDAIPAVVFIAPTGEKKVFIGTESLLPEEKIETIISSFLK